MTYTLEQSQTPRTFKHDLIIIGLVHLLLLLLVKTPEINLEDENQEDLQITKLKLVDMNLGLRNSNEQGQYLRNSDSKDSTAITKDSYKRINEVLDKYDQVDSNPIGKKISLSDLNLDKLSPEAIAAQWKPKPVQLKGSEIEQFLKDNNVRRIKYQDLTPSLNNSQVSIQMDIPEGFEIEKIDQLENVFYAFQRRISIAYVNSFYNQLSDFEFKNPHLQFPMTNQETTLIAKAIFDKNGNLQKLQMIKWTDIDKLQQFFVSVLDGIQSIPNPPSEFVKSKDTFTIYYSLKLN